MRQWPVNAHRKVARMLRTSLINIERQVNLNSENRIFIIYRDTKADKHGLFSCIIQHFLRAHDKTHLVSCVVEVEHKL